MSPLARAEWDRLAPELYRLGLLTQLDRAVFTAYCCSYARWCAAEKLVAEHGVVHKARNGRETVSPYVLAASRAFAEMRSLMPELGLTPSARSRIKAEPPVGLDPFEELLRTPS